MKFSVYFSIVFGMSLILLAVGYVIGFYMHYWLGMKYWAYVSIPILGIGTGFVFYGTLFKRDLGQ
ncbi:MAG: hypothetical protein HN729_12660 [Candidatus Marinimicrobia bacterium]|jgi:hypothetical protein|nr:hypothetical protein [Candidatus Neomarinimicrobiota bacterium]MBT3634671.1 hypothetical protein [Candidatus Neomarinimicrobiota bacterium]MBT3682699.1 hypothetical protein [Candidatus Neomarinimicrobiota bacterium]MBT3759646.1 hypothetical protein [Candidatus Neomarinimicrobiota bacterium]MBT3894482.1 hypothetical protein [Candidatus Neomarinimicrobiota bacterium]